MHHRFVEFSDDLFTFAGKNLSPFCMKKSFFHHSAGKTNTFFVVANDNLLTWIFNVVKQLSYVVQSIVKKAIPLTRKYALEKV